MYNYGADKLQSYFNKHTLHAVHVHTILLLAAETKESCPSQQLSL